MVQVIMQDIKITKYSKWLRWTLKAIYNKLSASDGTGEETETDLRQCW